LFFTEAFLKHPEAFHLLFGNNNKSFCSVCPAVFEQFNESPDFSVDLDAVSVKEGHRVTFGKDSH